MIESVRPHFIEDSLTCGRNPSEARRKYCAYASLGLLKLPVELRADLTDGRIAGIGDNAEGRAADVPGWTNKLRVVENVEKFDTEIESEILLNLGSLRYAEIGVVESRAVEEAAVGGAKSAQNGVHGECAGQEVASGTVGSRATGIGLARIHNHDRAHAIRHIRRRTASQRCVSGALVHLDGKAGGEASDPLNLPALGQAFGSISESSVERDGPNVTSDKIVS